MAIFLQALGIGLVATAMAVMLRGQRPEMAMLVAVAAGALTLLLLAQPLAEAVSDIQAIGNGLGIHAADLAVLVKIVGLSYLCEFGVQLCKDAGEGAVASKVELAGKVTIVAAAMPLVASLLENVGDILGLAA